jgi:signal transduction histidine kinase
MIPHSLLALTAALFSGGLALAVLLRKRRPLFATWCFAAGMGTLAVESALGGVGFIAASPEKASYWLSLAFVAKSFLPGIWLCFALTYSRGNYREFLARWRLVVAAAFLLPIGVAIGVPAKILDALLLIGTVLILMHLEETFRSTVGATRWRIKFVTLGLAVIFAPRIYTESQELLFSSYDLAFTDLETGALLGGCGLMTIAYVRRGFAEVDVYPSRAVLYHSVTAILAAGYLFFVGVLARAVALLGGAGSFQTQAFLVLAGIAVLGGLLISDRFRQGMQSFVSRHFKRPQHDFRKVWTLMTQGTSSVHDRAGLCCASARLISETFNALSVTIWLVDEQTGRLVLGCGMGVPAHEERVPGVPPVPPGQDARDTHSMGWKPMPPKFMGKMPMLRAPFDLERVREDWAENLRQINPIQFRNGGNRICVPLWAGDRWLGVAVLGDRVNGVPWTTEDLELLKCMGEQVAAGLLNLRLTEELMQAKELEAFQKMSAFFVHDFKNAASSLSLMLQNLRTHFANPAFQQDALRGIADAVNRLNLLIGRLSSLRHKLELQPVESDLNAVVNEALEGLNGLPEVTVLKELRPLPKVFADREQMQNVVTNLLLNARDVVSDGGQIRVETSQYDGHAVLSVADNGCGMSPAFVRDFLFRPFHTTKKNGLGIGLFQAQLIVEAHRGSIQVESEPGEGTTFRVILPLAGKSQTCTSHVSEMEGAASSAPVPTKRRPQFALKPCAVGNEKRDT